MRPVNLPRSASSNGGAKVVDTPDLSVEEDRSTTSSLNKIETKTDGVSKTDASTLRKATRQSDVSLSDEQSTGSLNDILTGLLNVVGEGLSIASNYVKENQKKKESEVMKYDSTLDMSFTYLIQKGIDVIPGFMLQSSSASKLSALSVSKNTLVTQTRVQAGIAPSRINNRGPPRFTEIPFEAIPLEVLSSQTPGQQPIVQIQQRPFQTRIKGAKPSAVIKVGNTRFIYLKNQH